MIKTVLKHFVYDYSLRYFCDNLIRNFSITNRLNYNTINNSHLHRKVKWLTFGNLTYEIGKPSHGSTYTITMYDMEIISEKESLKYRGPVEINISKKYPKYNYYILLSYTWRSEYKPVSVPYLIAQPFSENAELILE